MKLVFATHNQNKYEEVKQLMPAHIELFSLEMIGCFDDIEETGATLEENARIKADFVTKNYNLPSFSDDTGLLVNALNGAPGVYTARFGGEEKNAEKNMNKLLTELEGKQDRNAHFKTAIALNIYGSCHMFTGTVNGKIITKKRGDQGFGYDPIFVPDGFDETFAQLPLSIKNKIGHRGRAIQKLISFLNETNPSKS
ncbi:Non-canonical purine NTP pyrophosphatase [Croceitalea dokdonensis DOKDO 023]|uniref:dITP/XTP pyrophosphatase n=1 Tax=Croceitalea dokdonensis DOKDO 023 TaxID=1300341 RepID=A0A0P7AJD7_9FLAO|nr:non-canonical purine NTP diphosphatase [Croceitalea dokdonensis]KPM33733.1 Non-canonical purine NTP pyrophosphatase [Croceitalea dokdonensis DOKDO 023]